jgi:hypothetical protein
LYIQVSVYDNMYAFNFSLKMAAEAAAEGVPCI